MPLAEACRRFVAWRERRRGVFALIGVAGIVAGVAGLRRVGFEGDVHKLNYLRPESRRDEARVLAVWGEMASTSVVVRGPSREAALANNDRLFRLLEDLTAEGRIARFTSVAPVLPAPSTQAANRERWRAFFTPERVAAVRARVARAAEEAGFAPAAFEPFLARLGPPGLPLNPDDFTGTGLSAVVDRHLSERAGEYLVLSTFALREGANLHEVTDRIQRAIPGAVVMNRREFVAHTADLVRREVKRLAWVACAVMAVCLYLFLRRIELVLAVFLPVLFAFLLTMGALGLAGIPVNLISCLFIVFVFGVGIDYSIFLLHERLDAFRGRGGHREVTLGAVVICVVSTVSGFTALALAQHPALFSIGITGVVGMGSSLLAAVVVVPGVTRRLLPTDARRGTPTLGAWLAIAVAAVHLVGMEVVYLGVLRFFVFLRHPRDRAARQRFARWYLHKGASSMLAFFRRWHIDRVVLGRDREDFDRPAVIVSNHASMLDIMLILSLSPKVVMMVKDWVWRSPFMGLILRAADYIPVDRLDAEALLAAGKRHLANGVHVMVFPEGSRSPDGRVRRFHKGAFELAVRARAQVLPVLLTNTAAVVPRNASWLSAGRVVVRVLPRVGPAAHDGCEAFDYELGARALARHVKARMLAHVESDWRLAQQGRLFRCAVRSLYRYRSPFVESHVAWKLRLDPIYRRIDAFVPRAGVVFDAGCGVGLMGHILARLSRQRRVVGLDSDERKVRVAQMTAQAVPNLTFEHGDLLTVDLPEADAVILVDVLHYWRPERQRRLIARACDALRPGGVLVFRDACDSGTWRHRLTVWSERFSTATGTNRRGDGLHFLQRSFYLRAFEEGGLRLEAEPTDLGRGSNQVLVMRKCQ